MSLNTSKITVSDTLDVTNIQCSTPSDMALTLTNGQSASITLPPGNGLILVNIGRFSSFGEQEESILLHYLYRGTSATYSTINNLAQSTGLPSSSSTTWSLSGYHINILFNTSYSVTCNIKWNYITQQIF